MSKEGKTTRMHNLKNTFREKERNLNCLQVYLYILALSPCQANKKMEMKRKCLTGDLTKRFNHFSFYSNNFDRKDSLHEKKDTF